MARAAEEEEVAEVTALAPLELATWLISRRLPTLSQLLLLISQAVLALRGSDFQLEELGLNRSGFWGAIGCAP